MANPWDGKQLWEEILSAAFDFDPERCIHPRVDATGDTCPDCGTVADRGPNRYSEAILERYPSLRKKEEAR